jgi:signal transduction histidine kinase
MQRTDGSQSEWQEPMAPAHAAQFGAEVGAEAAPARARWLEKMVSKESIGEARQPIQLTRASRPSPWSDGSAQSLAGLIHDARNIVSAMDLYCDLLEEPGVLSAPFHHYAGELRLVSGAGRRLLEKMAVAESVTELQNPALQNPAQSRNVPSPRLRTDSRTAPVHSDGSLDGERSLDGRGSLDRSSRASRQAIVPRGRPVADLAGELRGNHQLLSALVGPGITIGLSISGGQRPVAMAGDDLTRVLVNLARNAAEAMPFGGHIQISLEEGVEYLALSFTDNGPGIPETALETIFKPGYSTHAGLASAPGSEPASNAASCAWPVQHRGLGLSIVRSLVTAAGGSIWAANRSGVPARDASQPTGDSGQDAEAVFQETSALQGAIFVIEFPLNESRAGT